MMLHPFVFYKNALRCLALCGGVVAAGCSNPTPATKQAATDTAVLYRSRNFTPPGSFTAGAEGPAVGPDGTIYAVNLHREGTVGKISVAGDTAVLVQLPPGSTGNGIRFDKKGRMLIADYTGHNILVLHPQTKEISVLAHEPRMNQPNDLAIDSRDRVYASDPAWKTGTGQLWRIDPDGRVTLLADNLGTTNGIEVSPDEKKLYVAESVQRKVWVFDLSDSGSISNKRLFASFPDHGMDGMRCDTAGNLYITRHGKGTVVVLSPGGEMVREITLLGKLPSNIAFGGPDGRAAYITLQDNRNMETFLIDVPGREWQLMHGDR